MEYQQRNKELLGTVFATILLAFSASVLADIDADAAKSLAQHNNCFICHSVDKKKVGPTFKSVAEKFHGNANAEARLISHLTVMEKAKFPDGHEEDHMILKDTDKSEIKNLVDWILSLQ